MLLISQHPDAAKQLQEENLDPTLGFVTKEAKDVYSWLNWIRNSVIPFGFDDLPNTRKYTNVSTISRNTLTKYLNLVTMEVERGIKEKLPDKFAIAFDG